MEFTYLSSKMMAKVDELAVRKYNLQIKQMMENAGRNVARWIMDNLKPKRVIALYGKGNNGGDAVCCARHLRIYGCEIILVPAFEGTGNKEVLNQITIFDRIGIKPSPQPETLREGDIIVDGLLGYNIKGNPKGKFAELIEWANNQKVNGAKIVSYDIPSGMNPDTGERYTPCMEPNYTITLALPKVGLKGEDVGKLLLGNIGIPNELYKKELDLELPNYFSKADIIEIK